MRLADHYRVSLRTIFRGDCVARVIDKIGEISSESRQIILAGKSPINKKELEGLWRTPTEELETIALEIAEGTYS